MSGNKCVYYNCGLTTRKDPSVSMFRFPVKNMPLCYQWILHSGNLALADLSPEFLRRKYICSRHFNKKYLTSKRLPCNAVPNAYVESDHEEHEEKENEDLNFNIDNVRATYSRNLASNSGSQKHNLCAATSMPRGSYWLERLAERPSSPQCDERIRALEEDNEYLKEKLQRAQQKISTLKSQLLRHKKILMKVKLQSVQLGLKKRKSNAKQCHQRRKKVY